MKKEEIPCSWTYKDSTELYGINHWGAGYFNISEDGEVTVSPRGKGTGHDVSLMDIISGLRDRGIDMPVLLRLSDILDARIKLLHESFASTIKEYGYKGQYRGVYPVKVNQQEQVLQEVTNFGFRYHHGLEVGSKAELIAAIPYMNNPDAYLICNGYKDSEFIDLGLYARKIGIKCIFVVEMPLELPLILDRAKKIEIDPILGVRIKLSTVAKGQWTNSGGENSAFGLTIAQVIDFVELLIRERKLNCLRLLHYHLGSQIPNIRDIRTGVVEACRVYAGLVKEGAPMGIIDLGGGLAVDYDGTHTSSPSSSNYTLKEYCADIIEVIMSSLEEDKISHPTIITESGRFTVAYYSVLIFNILDVRKFQPQKSGKGLSADSHELLKNLSEVAALLSEKNIQECYNDAIYYRDEIFQLFKHGAISLRERAEGEQIFWQIIVEIAKNIEKMDYVPEELMTLESFMADTYYGNFSLFQSLPDAWAIDQLFPVIPIHRLNEFPSRKAVISDITCDCDGVIDKFIGRPDMKKVLQLHNYKPFEDYYLGIFLVGAYQETLGDLHNLLGDTNIVSIKINKNGEVEFSKEINGDSVADVLSYVEFDPKDMIVKVRQLAEQAVKKGCITPLERRQIMAAYESGLRGYTYYEG